MFMPQVDALDLQRPLLRVVRGLQVLPTEISTKTTHPENSGEVAGVDLRGCQWHRLSRTQKCLMLRQN